MNGLRLDDPIERVPGVGPVRARQLAEAGIGCVEDLLMLLPIRYEDRRRRLTISQLRLGVAACVAVTMRSCHRVRGGGRRVRVQGRAEDPTGSVELVWFNQPYVANRLTAGSEVILYGRPTLHDGHLQLVNPGFTALPQPGTGPGPVDRIVPVYRRLGELRGGTIGRLVRGALQCVQDADDALPAAVRRELDLMPYAQALHEVHEPEPDTDFETLSAGCSAPQRALAMRELIEFQTAVALHRRRATTEPGIEHALGPALCERVRGCLPFTLTGSQSRCLETVLGDLRAASAMHRLVQGDVGSGKTAVAACALLAVVAAGEQAVLLAPTEILARQHARTLAPWAQQIGVAIAVLTGTTPAPERRDLLVAAAAGEPMLLVGTHALLQPRVRFGRLGLVVIDEQHRFGVEQRAHLRRQGRRRGRYPDLLVMTATPIPRSLAMTLYGDLDPTRIEELPPGRLPVRTHVQAAAAWGDVIERIGAAATRGDKVFVVVPRIAQDEAVRSVLEVHAELVSELGTGVVELVHGGQAAADRNAAMGRFVDGNAAVLVATTVVEVGVDVPAATLMVIVHAERFGLAQLHQLRGRVGRGAGPGECWLVACPPLSNTARARLRAVRGCSDGFRLAEEDLRLRGPGELLGTRQTGELGLRLADPLAQPQWLLQANRVARRLATSSQPEEIAYRERLRQTWQRRLQMARAG